MFKDSKAFSTFSADDIPRAKRFYGETLGLSVSDDEIEPLHDWLRRRSCSSTTASRALETPVPVRRVRSPSAPASASTSTSRAGGP